MGTVWPLGSATVTLLGPVTGYSDTNNTSLVLRIDYGNTSFLLTGDMEKTAETDLASRRMLNVSSCGWPYLLPVPQEMTPIAAGYTPCASCIK